MSYFVPSNKICSSFLKSKGQCQGGYKYNQLLSIQKATKFEKRANNKALFVKFIVKIQRPILT